MDGVALRSRDTVDASSSFPIHFHIVGRIEAGQQWNAPLGPNEAIWIGTGSALPVDCDTVLPIESIAPRGNWFELTAPCAPGRHVRPAGEDIRAGTVAVTAGIAIRPQDIGLIAALGLESVPVIRRPTVGVVSIGQELEADAKPTQVADANGPMLAALMTEAGAEIRWTARVDNSVDRLRSLLDDPLEPCDLIVSSGGISNGNADTMTQVLSKDPAAELWTVRLRPGKHFGVAFHEGHTLIALPGNPIAALVGCMLFAHAAIDRLAGRADRSPSKARIVETASGSSGRTDALRGYAWLDESGQLLARPAENRGSAVLSSLGAANCLILIPEERAALPPGDIAEIRWLGYQ
ncbi:MAG: molybdopterin molybdotransferase MoeA [Thermomicrobiales bacterium]|nr:molybdopterin molybdotransferase MoeA [Thermomicrobiales bacterium]